MPRFAAYRDDRILAIEESAGDAYFEAAKVLIACEPEDLDGVKTVPISDALEYPDFHISGGDAQPPFAIEGGVMVPARSRR